MRKMKSRKLISAARGARAGRSGAAGRGEAEPGLAAPRLGAGAAGPRRVTEMPASRLASSRQHPLPAHTGTPSTPYTPAPGGRRQRAGSRALRKRPPRRHRRALPGRFPAGPGPGRGCPWVPPLSPFFTREPVRKGTSCGSEPKSPAR